MNTKKRLSWAGIGWRYLVLWTLPDNDIVSVCPSCNRAGCWHGTAEQCSQRDTHTKEKFVRMGELPKGLEPRYHWIDTYKEREGEFFYRGWALLAGVPLAALAGLIAVIAYFGWGVIGWGAALILALVVLMLAGGAGMGLWRWFRGRPPGLHPRAYCVHNHALNEDNRIVDGRGWHRCKTCLSEGRRLQHY